MCFAGNDDYQDFQVFVPMLSSPILDGNKKAINWILTGISSKKIKSFDSNLEPTISNLANSKVILIFNNSVLVQKQFSLLYINFVLNIYVIYELNTCSCNASNSLTLKSCLFGIFKLTRNEDKSIFSCNGLGKAFDGKGYWNFDNDIARNVVIFGVGNSS